MKPTWVGRRHAHGGSGGSAPGSPGQGRPLAWFQGALVLIAGPLTGPLIGPLTGPLTGPLSTLFMRKGLLTMLAFVRKQHKVKVTLSANMSIVFITYQDSDWELGY